MVNGEERVSGMDPQGIRSPFAIATRQAEVPARDSCYPLPMFPPERIVCLTEETVETLYLLGEDHRLVGVSGYAVRPARVRREKPHVSAL
jgi:ABC-type hemin transport system substrate-binding protein